MAYVEVKSGRAFAIKRVSSIPYDQISEIISDLSQKFNLEVSFEKEIEYKLSRQEQFAKLKDLGSYLPPYTYQNLRDKRLTQRIEWDISEGVHPFQTSFGRIDFLDLVPDYDLLDSQKSSGFSPNTLVLQVLETSRRNRYDLEIYNLAQDIENLNIAGNSQLADIEGVRRLSSNGSEALIKQGQHKYAIRATALYGRILERLVQEHGFNEDLLHSHFCLELLEDEFEERVDNRRIKVLDVVRNEGELLGSCRYFSMDSGLVISRPLRESLTQESYFDDVDDGYMGKKLGRKKRKKPDLMVTNHIMPTRKYKNKKEK